MDAALDAAHDEFGIDLPLIDLAVSDPYKNAVARVETGRYFGWGIALGFLIVVLGRQQLFTENTLTAILPLLRTRTLETLTNVLRLWIVVLISNLLGALVLAWVAVDTTAFDDGIREEFLAIGRAAMQYGFTTVLLRAIFAGWLIALILDLRPSSSDLTCSRTRTRDEGRGRAKPALGCCQISKYLWLGLRVGAGVRGMGGFTRRRTFQPVLSSNAQMPL